MQWKLIAAIILSITLSGCANDGYYAPVEDKSAQLITAIPTLPQKIASSPPHTDQILSHWRWPAQGTVMHRFARDLPASQGIDIAGSYGDPIYSAASGIVIYSGAGVRGYGNLIIVKHSNQYLSAYAFNKRILVKDGYRVRIGQKIAEMGRDDSGRVMLHFEIRRNGVSVNPLHYLS